MVVWSANFIVVKDVIGIVPPVAFSFVRYALSSLTRLLLLRWSEGEIRRPAGLGRILLSGALGFGVYQMLWTVGLQTIPAGSSALLIAATPVLTAVIAALVGADTLTPNKAIGVAVSFVGVILVIASGVGIELTGSPIGFALTLGAALCWAIYTAVGARAMSLHTPLSFTTWATIGGTLALAPIGVGQLVSSDTVGTLTADQWPTVAVAIVYSGIVAAALSNILVLNGVRLLGPTRITTTQALVPAMAVVLAFVFLHEPIHLGQVLGGAIIIAGVALTRRASGRYAGHRR
jgi:drug/metabolite transporter (DMT)-like permease